MVLSVKFCKIDPHYPYIGRLLQYFVTFLTIHVGVTLFDHHSPQHSPFPFFDFLPALSVGIPAPRRSSPTASLR